MDKTKSGFIDFIPEGQEEGSPYGKGGYLDFVPPVEPKPQVIEEAAPTQELVEEVTVAEVVAEPVETPAEDFVPPVEPKMKGKK